MTKNILVVDDDVQIGNLLEEVLGREGYAVWRAYSGTEALLLLGAKRPDLILLDLMLPGLSGEGLLPKTEGIPVIVVSAKADVSDKVSLLRGGADFVHIADENDIHQVLCQKSAGGFQDPGIGALGKDDGAARRMQRLDQLGKHVDTSHETGKNPDMLPLLYI